jgi:hypothetical protein
MVLVTSQVESGSVTTANLYSIMSQYPSILFLRNQMKTPHSCTTAGAHSTLLPSRFHIPAHVLELCATPNRMLLTATTSPLPSYIQNPPQQIQPNYKLQPALNFTNNRNTHSLKEYHWSRLYETRMNRSTTPTTTRFLLRSIWVKDILAGRLVMKKGLGVSIFLPIRVWAGAICRRVMTRRRRV